MKSLIRFLKKIWRRTRSFLLKKPPSAESILEQSKGILLDRIPIDELYRQIDSALAPDAKEQVFDRIAKRKSAESLMTFIESESIAGKTSKAKRKTLYQLHELQSELTALEKERAKLDYQHSKIGTAEYVDSSFLTEKVEAIKGLFNLHKTENGGITLNHLGDHRIGNTIGLEKLLDRNSLLILYKSREKEKRRQEELYNKQIKQKLASIEQNVKPAKVNIAKNLIKELESVLKPTHVKEHQRLFKLKEKIKEIELSIFRQQYEREQKLHEQEKQRIREEEARRAEERAKAKALQEQEAKRLLTLQMEKESTLVALRTKKANWEDYDRVLTENGITCFYHFTNRKNLESIRKHKGLYSWYHCEKAKIEIPNSGGDALSRDLDRRHKLQDYVRLSFCKQHPMQYRLIQDGHDLVVLKIKKEAAFWTNTRFSDRNATDKFHRQGDLLENLMNINFSATRKTFVRKEDPDFPYLQAEVLVKTHIPLEYIMNLSDFE